MGERTGVGTPTAAASHGEREAGEVCRRLSLGADCVLDHAAASDCVLGRREALYVCA